MSPREPETVREVVDAILDDCGIPQERHGEYHELAAKAVWRDRSEVLEIAGGSQEAPGGGPEGRVARFVQDQAFGRKVRPL